MPALAPPISRNDWIRKGTERNGITELPFSRVIERVTRNAGPWEPAVRQIVELQHLKDDWDGFGAKAPSHELLASAIGLANLLNEKGMGPPQRVAPGVDGSLILEWQDTDGTYAEVEVLRPFYAEVMSIEPGQPARHWTLPTD